MIFVVLHQMVYTRDFCCSCATSILTEKSIIDPILYGARTTGQQIQSYLEAVEMYSKLGLRTLCIGWRELEEDEYKTWSKRFQDASCSLEDREVHCSKP
jgi:phospholipid-translocating ATPase